MGGLFHLKYDKNTAICHITSCAYPLLGTKLFRLKFPRDGDDYLGCEWVTVIAQGVPPHIGSPTPGCGYEDGDPYAAFLPPPVETDENGEAEYLRAVVFVTE